MHHLVAPNSRSFLFSFVGNVTIKAASVKHAICVLHFAEKIGGNIKANSARIEFLEFSNLVIVKHPRTNYKYL